MTRSLTTGSGGGRYDKQPVTVSEAVTSKWAKQSGGPAGDEDQNLVVASSLSHGSNPNSNVAGHRREDDRDLIVEEVDPDPDEDLVAFYPTGGSKDHFWDEDGVTPPLKIGSGVEAPAGIAVAQNQRGELRESEVAMQLTGGGGKPGEGYSAVRLEALVRRLTPTECERLQGLPDGWTDVGGAKDSKRYAALGDAVTAPVAHWIGEGIRMLEAG